MSGGPLPAAPPPPPPLMEPRRSNRWAGAATACGILAVLFGVLPRVSLVSYLVGGVAVVAGVLAIPQARRSGLGWGLSITGLITGTLGIAMATAWLIGSSAVLRSVTGESARVDEVTAEPAWVQVLDQIEPDDTVSKETALQAFSLAVASLPDVEVPKGPDMVISSGSGAIRWVMAHLDEVTGEQRAAIQAAIRRPEGTSNAASGGNGLGGGTGRIVLARAATATSATATYEALYAEAAALITQRLGSPAPAEFEIFLTSGGKEKAWMSNIPVILKDGQVRCEISINPHGTIEAIGEQAARAALTHEVMHCAIRVLVGAGNYESLPPWLHEGIPAWVGESVVGGTFMSEKWWKRYLEEPLMPLFSRTYDAIGFYSHLDNRGVDPWTVFKPMLTAGGSSPAFGVAAKAGDDPLLDTWGPGYMRDASLGPAWNTTGPGITNHMAAVPHEIVTNDWGSYTSGADGSAVYVSTVDLQADVVRFTALDFGYVRFADGGQRRLQDTFGHLFCTLPGGCKCPEGSPGAGLTFEQVPAGMAHLAATGGPTPTQVKVQGWSLETACGNPPEPTPPEEGTSDPDEDGPPAGPDFGDDDSLPGGDTDVCPALEDYVYEGLPEDRPIPDSLGEQCIEELLEGMFD